MGETDKERELSTHGIRESLLIGSYLSKQKLIPDIIITSAARRARACADLVSDALKSDPEKIIVNDEFFQASPRTFLDIINQFDDSLQHVLCIAHNPTITYVAEYLTKAEIGDLVPAGLAIIRFNLGSWSQVGAANGELVNYIYPSMLIND